MRHTQKDTNRETQKQREKARDSEIETQRQRDSIKKSNTLVILFYYCYYVAFSLTGS